MLQDVTLVGIDLGKHSFHLHGQDRRGKGVFRGGFVCSDRIPGFLSGIAGAVVMPPKGSLAAS